MPIHLNYKVVFDRSCKIEKGRDAICIVEFEIVDVIENEIEIYWRWPKNVKIMYK